MAKIQELQVNHVTANVTLTDGVESVAVSSGGVILPYQTAKIVVVAWAQVTLAASTTGLIPRIRRGTAITGALITTTKGRNNFLRSVAWSRDGNHLAALDVDKIIIWAWDPVAQTLEKQRTLTGHSNVVLSVAFSPDGQRLASGSDDTTVRIWDTQTGKQTLTLNKHTQSIYSVHWSPDGKRLASASDDSTIQIWDARPGYDTERQRVASEAASQTSGKQAETSTP